MTTTTIKKIKKIIKDNKNDIAFVVGNGINRYPKNPKALSWDDLLNQLWENVSPQTLKKLPNGISLTEFYDILELEKRPDINLQEEVVKIMKDWEPLNHHRKITAKIKDELNAPILTTNFDETIAKTFNYELFRTKQETKQEGFTDFYPWTTYHGENRFDLPTDGFGIWYINGMIKYPRSIRLGISHYMGSIERARSLLHSGDDCLFSKKKGKNANEWKGSNTWLHIIFNKSLFIFGLGLEENEIFLRWLLIERMRYFKCFPERVHKGWYITSNNKTDKGKKHKELGIEGAMNESNNETDKGKKLFLEFVGFEVIEVDDYEDIYEKIWE
jgi:hypothetical protein